MLTGSDAATPSAQRPVYDGDSRFEGNYPSFPLAQHIERNHLILVVTAIADMGTREYSRVNLKAPGSTDYTGPASPGVRTTVRSARVESVIKGTPTGNASEILVEELFGLPNLTPGVRYLLLVSPWHPGTYQAGAYGALVLADGALTFAGGEPVGVVFPELKGQTGEQARDVVQQIVEQQRSGDARVAVVQPIPGREYDREHLWSLADVREVTLEGVPLQPETATLLKAMLHGVSVAVAGPPTATRPGTLVLHLSGGQTIDILVDVARGVARFPDGTEVPLPPDAAALLRQGG